MAPPANKFSITILGANSALPANGRNPTAQLINVNHQYYLVDCGEGTQLQLRKFGLKMQRIKVVFISHMHGDHYFGLIGLLNSLHLLGRKMPLTIIAPSELEEIINMQLRAGGGYLQYPIYFQSITLREGCAEPLYEDERIKVRAFPLKHRIPCAGFLFEEQPRERTYLPKEGAKRHVRVEDIPKLKKGMDVCLPDGIVIRVEEVTESPLPPRVYAYCTDTLPLDSTARFVEGVNCLYHEATFLETEKKRAKETFHSTAMQAAEVALKAGAKRLIIGHYSARYDEIDGHLFESKKVFSNTDLALEGKVFEIN